MYQDLLWALDIQNQHSSWSQEVQCSKWIKHSPDNSSWISQTNLSASLLKIFPNFSSHFTYLKHLFAIINSYRSLLQHHSSGGLFWSLNLLFFSPFRHCLTLQWLTHENPVGPPDGMFLPYQDWSCQHFPNKTGSIKTVPRSFLQLRAPKWHPQTDPACEHEPSKNKGTPSPVCWGYPKMANNDFLFFCFMSFSSFTFISQSLYTGLYKVAV